VITEYKELDAAIEHIRNVGEQLVPYNFPQADPQLEDEMGILKTQELCVDGYHIIIHFSKAFHNDYYLETLQILGKKVPFLPFNLVVKLAKKFLGSHHLSLSEILRDNRKIYCWTITVDAEGHPLPSAHEEAKFLEFEGFEYAYIDAQFINFY
jgi:hypothetical protein